MTKKTTKQQIAEIKAEFQDEIMQLQHELNQIKSLLDQTINDQVKNDVDYNQRFNKIREENTKQWEAIKRRQLKLPDQYTTQTDWERAYRQDERRYQK